ncbi:MAG: ribosome biogenesis GTP-binding protein YihA/YsxC, partial [Candidatus Methylomirabilales bacterium]
LRGRELLRAVIIIVDARHPPTTLDQEMGAWLQAARIPQLIVLTKVDKIERGAWRRSREITAAALGIHNPKEVFLFSAVTGEGEEELWQRLAQYLQHEDSWRRGSRD